MRVRGLGRRLSLGPLTEVVLRAGGVPQGQELIQSFAHLFLSDLPRGEKALGALGMLKTKALAHLEKRKVGIDLTLLQSGPTPAPHCVNAFLLDIRTLQQ